MEVLVLLIIVVVLGVVAKSSASTVAVRLGERRRVLLPLAHEL